MHNKRLGYNRVRRSLRDMDYSIYYSAQKLRGVTARTSKRTRNTIYQAVYYKQSITQIVDCLRNIKKDTQDTQIRKST